MSPDAPSASRRASDVPSLWRSLYLILVIGVALMGVCLTFTIPLFLIPDENAHWIQGHSRVERLRRLSRTDCVPTVSLDEWFQLEPMRSHAERKMVRGKYERLNEVPMPCVKAWDEYGDVLTYPGVIASKLLLWGQTTSSERQIQALIMTRLLQGAMVVLCLLRLAWLARRSRPTGLLVVGAFVLSPLFAQQSFGVSSDGVGLCFGVSLVAVTLFWDRLSRLDLFLFLLFGWGATAKPFILPCLLTAVTVGWWYARLRAGEPAGLRAALRGFADAWKPTSRPSVQTLLLWSAAFLTVTTIGLALFNLGTIKVGKPGVDGTAQLAYLRANPSVLWSLFWNATPRWWVLHDWTGQLGWLDVNFTEELFSEYRWAVALAFGLELIRLAATRARLPGKAAAPPASARWAVVPVGLVGLLSVFASWLLVVVVLYLRWTPVGKPEVQGFQIRYLFTAALFGIAVVIGALEIALSRSRDRAEPAVGLGARLAPWLTTSRVHVAWTGLRWLVLLFAAGVVLRLVSRVFLEVMGRFS
jgi:hypothetical protein